MVDVDQAAVVELVLELGAADAQLAGQRRIARRDRLARWRRSLAASAAASAGSSAPSAGGGNTRDRSTNAWEVATTTNPSWEKAATASFGSGSWARMPAGPTTTHTMT
jgi:hypothetical protein